jgi:ABC-type bacteriocin/lantibiotic exporter with double-glycine peptidase domain
VKLQEKRYSCGPAALRAALYMLGRKVRESTIRKIAGTTPQEGTDEFGLFKAIKHYGYEYDEYTDKDPTRGWNRIKRNLRIGQPSILCVSCSEDLDHWVSAIGLNGDNVIIFDPQNPDSKSKKYSGLQVVDIDDFYEKWSFTDEDGIDKFYSITIVKEE